MTASSYYAWGTESMPVSVLLNIEVIHEVNDAMVAAMRAEPGRGLEIGGVLLGRMEYRRQERPVIHIERFEPVDCEHRRGSSFVLTESDKRHLAKRLAAWNRKHETDLRPVGFFRSHTRKGLYLDNDDFSVIQTYFPERFSVFLLVRPVPGASPVAGFFFWDNGDMHRESSLQEFPFDATRLPLVTPEPSQPEPEVAAPPVSAAQSPIPSRPTAVTAPAVTARGSTPVPPRTREAAASAAVPRPTGSGRRRNWMQAAVPVAAVLLFGITFYIARIVTASHRQAAETPAPLQVARNSPAPMPVPVAPTANPQAAIPTPAGAQPEAIDKPSPFRVKPPNQPAAAAAAAAPVPAPAPTPETAGAPGSTTNTGSASRTVPNPETGPVAPPAATPEPGSGPSATLSPSTAAPAPMAAITVPARVQTTPRRAPVATVTVEPVTESKIGRFVGRIPGLRRLEKKNRAFVPARPIREITPAVPSSAELEHEEPVDLRVTIDPTGKVASIEPTRGDRRLVQLATDAARNWEFEPARRNDETVSSELILHFTFRPPVTQAEP